MPGRVLLIVVLATTAVLGACSAGTGADGSWTLSELTVDGEQLAIPAEVTLVVDGDRVSGTSGCNTYSGEATTDDDAVVVSSVAVTQMFCEDTDVMALEARFLDELVSNRWTVEAQATTLSLVAVDDPSTVLTFSGGDA